MNNKMAEKIRVEIFVPSGKCSCSFSQWVQNIWDKLDSYIDYVDVETTDTNSKRAKELGITGQTLLVDNERVLVFYLKEKLAKLMKEKKHENKEK